MTAVICKFIGTTDKTRLRDKVNKTRKLQQTIELARPTDTGHIKIAFLIKSMSLSTYDIYIIMRVSSSIFHQVDFFELGLLPLS